MIATLEWLNDNIGSPDTVILDTRPAPAYAYGHIAGSHSLSIERVIKTDRYGSNLVLDAPDAEMLFGSLGIDSAKTVVLAGEAMDPSVARIAWTLMYYGHEKTMILDPAVSALPGLGVELVRKVPELVPAKFEARPRPELRAMADDILESPDSFTILDARTPQEFMQGHLPGATLAPFTDGLGTHGTIFAPRQSLEGTFEKIPKDRPIACYCMYGHRGASLLYQLRMAGFEDVRLYDGSFVQWARRRLPLG